MKYHKGDLFAEVDEHGKILPHATVWIVSEVVDGGFIVECTIPYNEYLRTGTIYPKENWGGFTARIRGDSLYDFVIIKKAGIIFK